MNILRFNEFVNESNEQVNESGIPFFRGSILEPERTIKRNKLLQELQVLLGEVANGELLEITVIAEIPTQGKNTPQYLKDIYAEMGMEDKEDEEDKYDPETDVFLGDRSKNPDEPKHNIFVDSEFLVKDVDITKNIIIGSPYSLKGKNLIIEIDPENVEEVFVK